MKKMLPYLIIALLAISCNSGRSDLKNDLVSANLKGRVIHIDRTFHDANAKCACPAAQKCECNQEIFNYDEHGNLQESSMVDDNGNIAWISRYVYNGRGLCKEIRHFKGEILTGKEIFSINGHKVIGSRIFNAEGLLDNGYNYIYKGDQISEEQTINSDSKVTGTVINEFENGQISAQTRKDKDGKIISVSKYKRNGNSDIVEIVLGIPRDNTEFVLTLEYEYDNQGNWIKQTQLYNGEIQNITIRNITYYNSLH
jgi:hypothetical protein